MMLFTVCSPLSRMFGKRLGHIRIGVHYDDGDDDDDDDDHDDDDDDYDDDR